MRRSLFFFGSRRDDERIHQLANICESHADTIRWIQTIEPSTELLDWLGNPKPEILTHVAILRRFIHECPSDWLLCFRDNISLTKETLHEILHSEVRDYLVDCDSDGLASIRFYLMPYRFALRCLQILDGTP